VTWWQRLRGNAPESDVELDPASVYVAAPGRRRAVNFKREDEVDGEEIGPVVVTDEDDPEFVHELGWMRLSDARELARQLGHPLNEE
jgi:hypothetical protein